MENITNLIRIKSNPKLNMTPEGDFFRYWVAFLEPLHELTKREMDVLAAFLKMRYTLGKVIIDEETLDRILMQKETKRDIRESLGMTPKHFQVAISKLKKRGVIVDKKIPPNLIPTITDEGAGLMIHFSFKNEQHIKLGPKKSIQETMR
jgi:hypothetical protein